MIHQIKFSVGSFVMISCILVISQCVLAQKAYPVEITSLLSKIPVPSSSDACFATCNKKTDPSNGAVSIIDEGSVFKELQNILDEINKAAMQDMSAAGHPTSPPTADQIEQMKQQAMQRASEAQAQSANPQQAGHPQAGTPSTQPKDNSAEIGRQIGQAQTVCGQISQLINEFSMKTMKLDKSNIENVPSGPNCPEVQQGGYAGPTCACMKGRAADYESKRVAARNDYLSSASGLLMEYLGKIKILCTTVDNIIAKVKYGDAVSNPVYKQMVVSIQRQALGAVPALLGFSQSNWEDAAKQYAGLVNAKSGASVGCYGK